MIMTAGRPALSIRDLVVHFEQEEGVVRALEGVSLDAHPGRTLGIGGESGCGKSVTARAAMRLEEKPGRILSGRILLDQGEGVPPLDLAALDPRSRAIQDIRGRRIGLVFQEPMTSLSVHYSVGNQVGEVLRRHRGLSKPAAREGAIALLREVGIPRPERRADEYPFQLSGGLRQRVMVAMALAGQPDILIADEPTTALDVTTQAQILDLLRRLQHERQLALILITHDMGVIAEMATDVAVMYLGRVVEHGPVDRIFHAPRHPYTRMLLRSIPSVLAEPRSRLATISGSVPHPYRRPSGCPFHPRCPDAIPGRCDTAMPTEMALPDGGGVSCFAAEREAEIAAGRAA
jgi:peptide/nickel transport system ATP-binding protein